MDADILIENKDCFYGDDFLEQLLAKECQWSSLLDAADASPSEILADAVPILVPPISPDLSVKSSPSSSNSDSGSEDDSKNSSSGASARQSSQSPFDWMSSFEDEPTSNLNLEDVELFLQKTGPIDKQQPKVNEKKGPMVSIENGVIKGIKLVTPKYKTSNQSQIHKGLTQNSYFKVVNEHSQTNGATNIEKPVSNQNIKLVIEPKTVPSILERPRNVCSPSLVIQADSTNGGKIAIVPVVNKSTDFKDINMVPAKVTTSRSSIDQNMKSVPTLPAAPVAQNSGIPSTEVEYSTIEFSNCNDAELRAIKKQQRMIKNRESACQSRQKKKEYVSALEQQLLEAQQEIARLRLENKLLRDHLDNGGRGRKIPRLDTSLFIPKKNIAVLFAMVFMVSINFNVLGWNSKPIMGPSAPHTSTRHLLWADENSPDIAPAPDPDQLTNATYGTNCRNSTKSDMAINQTESIRIAGELNRWIGGGKTLNWTYDAPRRRRHVYLNEKIDNGLLESFKLFKQLNLDPNLIDFPSVKNSRNVRDKSRLRRLRRRDMDFPDNVLNLYHKPLKKSIDDFDMVDFGEWNALLQALQRRDDTFYVVGVGKGEHLLLPAVTHNDTRPPKMALILPAASGNDSRMNDHVTLMQIECSVVNTTLVQLKSDTLPESLRKKNNDELMPAKQHFYHNAKPDGNATKPRLYDDPKPKHNTSIGTNKDTVDASLSKSQNSNTNLSSSPQSATKHNTKNDVGKDDTFANYLFSKYESSKNISVTMQKRNVTIPDVNIGNGTKSP